MADVSKLLQRAIAQLPELNPRTVPNSTPGPERKIELRDSSDVLIDTIDVNAGDEEKWVGMTVQGRAVASVCCVTPSEVMNKETQDDNDIKCLEGIADRLTAIESRLTALEGK